MENIKLFLEKMSGTSKEQLKIKLKVDVEEKLQKSGNVHGQA